MPDIKMPPWLLTGQSLAELIEILQEKEEVRCRLKGRAFGARVTNQHQARLLLTGIMQVAGEVLDRLPAQGPEPELKLTRRLSRLPGQCLKLFLFLLPISLGLFYLVFSTSPAGSARWFLGVLVVFIQATPLLIYRRTRLNIEHECGYVRDESGRSVIVIDQLPAVQFQSFLAHEYAHHLLVRHFSDTNEAWIREGWARLFQWHVSRHLSLAEDNPAYLHHVLLQIIGELKFAIEEISQSLGRRLPGRVRRIRTIYHRNPVHNLLTGTPGFSRNRLLEHSFGTAACFLAEKRLGFKALPDGLNIKAATLTPGTL